MKFLTGLLAGAALILALNGELHQGKVADLAGSMWSVLLKGTADYLFPAVDGVIADAATRESEAARPVPLLETASIPAPARATAPAPAPAPAPALSALAPPEVQPELAVTPVLPEPPAPESAPADLVSSELVSSELEAAPVQPAPVPANEATEFVWKPFQSKISASGFANRLALSLDHPFDVHRKGPGRYQVGFTYGSDEERALVLQQIAQITGTTR